MTAPVALPQISYTGPGFDAAFMASLQEYGFAAVVDHPLDDDRVARIYGEWLAFFSSGKASGFRMDPVKQDGYFSLEEAEHAKGFVERDFKEYFQFYPWGRCPESLQADLASHFAAAVDLGAELLNCIARSLPEAVTAELTEPLRDMIHGSEQSMLRVLHYPPVPTGRSVLRRPLMRTLTYSPCCLPRTALGSSCNCAVASGFPCRMLPAN